MLIFKIFHDIVSKKFKLIIENEEIFKSNPGAMTRLKHLVDTKKSFKFSFLLR